LLFADAMTRSLVLAFSGCLLGGCLSGIDSPEPGSATAAEPDAAVSSVTDFDRAMMEIARSYKSFAKIDRRAYTSTLGAFGINVFVHGDVNTYRSIHPESTTTEAMKIDVGTVIVREVLDANGQVAKLTLMAKGPAGYDPTLGDWWFGQADPMGTPTKMGRLTECHSCHVPRANEDFLFGVPREDQR
jgi:hypothetical protein